MPGETSRPAIGLSLFDMENDPCETTNVIHEHPGIAKRLQMLAEIHRRKFYGPQKN